MVTSTNANSIYTLPIVSGFRTCIEGLQPFLELKAVGRVKFEICFYIYEIKLLQFLNGK